MRENYQQAIDRTNAAIAIVKNDPELYEKWTLSSLFIAVNEKTKQILKVIWKKIKLCPDG
jgi:hypothetical protein